MTTAKSGSSFFIQRKRYSPKHLMPRRIAVRPSFLLLPLLITFLLGLAAGAVIKEPMPALAVSDTVSNTVPNTVSEFHSDDFSDTDDIRQVSVLPEEIPVTEPAEPAQPEVPTEPTASTPIAEEHASEPIRHRDDIVSDGQLLDYDLQDVMQDCCEKYNVPYALALAIAEVESHFDPDAESSTSDYGLMQINAINFDWLRSLGLDPLTPEGNIESGVYILAQNLQAYGDPELALMAYNNGPTGARKLWDTGVYQTAYSQKVMAAFAKWTSILEA